MALSIEQGFAQRRAQGRILLGWTLVEQGRGAEGIAQLRQSVAAYGATGADLGRSSYLALLADAYGKRGQAEEGLTAIAEALIVVHDHRICFNEAELYRLKGELLLKRDELEPSGLTEAEACFARALERGPPTAGEVPRAPGGPEPGPTVAAPGQVRRSP